MELTITHISNKIEKAIFSIAIDAKKVKEISLTSPKHYLIDQHNINLQDGLRWLMEEYKLMPIDPNKIKAKNIEDALIKWGKEIYQEIFKENQSKDLTEAVRHYPKMKIVSKDPEVLMWPWEAMVDTDDKAAMGLEHHFIRQLSKSECNQPKSLKPDLLPNDSLNVLYIISRPDDDRDVDFSPLVQPLIDFAYNENEIWPVHIKLLRPPTLDQLIRTLEDKPNFYHIVHFDGHGTYRHNRELASSGGFLKFEKHDEAGIKPDFISAGSFAKILNSHNIPLVILNACQSAMTDYRTTNIHASVATSLLSGGMHGVIAMGYNLSVCGAKEFVPEFYKHLLRSGNIAEALKSGRNKMYHNRLRDSVVGQIEFSDWLVPVLYQQDCPEVDNVLPKLLPNKEREVNLPREELAFSSNFDDRDSDILQLERAIAQEEQVCILVHGLMGIGKTSLIKSFLRWLHFTNGLGEGGFYFDFSDTGDMNHIITSIGSELFGTNISELSEQEMFTSVCEKLKNNRYIMIWDSLDAVTDIREIGVLAQKPEGDKQILKRILDELHGGKTKILITSRSSERWLSDRQCFRLPLTSLPNDMTWQSNDERILEVLKSITDDTLVPVLRLLGLHKQFAFVGFIMDMLSQIGQNVPRHVIELCFSTLEQAGLSHPETEDLSLLHPSLSSWLNRLYPPIEADERAFAEIMASIADGITEFKSQTQLYILSLFLENMHQALNVAEKLNLEQLSIVIILRIAAYSISTRNFDIAETFLVLLAEKTKKSDKYFELEYNAYLELGKIFESKNKPDVAETWYMKVSEVCLYRNDELGLADAYHQLGNLSYKKGDDERASNWYHESLKIRKNHPRHAELGGIHHAIGNILLRRRDFQGAKEQYLAAEKIAREVENDYGLALAYYQLGLTALEEWNLSAAERYFGKSIEIEKERGNEIGIANNYDKLGVLYARRDDRFVAQDWFRRSLDIWIKYDIKQRIGDLCHQLGVITFESKDYQTSYMWYQEALEAQSIVGDRKDMAATYYQLGKIAEVTEVFSEAEKWYSDAMGIFRELDNKHDLAAVYIDIGKLMEVQEDLSSADKWYEMALEMCIENKFVHLITHIYSHKGDLASRRSDWTSAEGLFKKALLEFEDAGDLQNAKIVKIKLDNVRNKIIYGGKS